MTPRVGEWKVLLRPSASAGGSFTATLKSSGNTNESVVLTDITFGDVYFCSGQSNSAIYVLPFLICYACMLVQYITDLLPHAHMTVALSTKFTFSADTIVDAVQKKGQYSNLRIFRYGAMRVNESLMSNQNRWVTSLGSFDEDPVNNRWFNLSAAMQVTAEQATRHSSDDATPFQIFSAT